MHSKQIYDGCNRNDGFTLTTQTKLELNDERHEGFFQCWFGNLMFLCAVNIRYVIITNVLVLGCLVKV